MLNVGMTEILCFAVVAILVLGPDKLPEAARFAGKTYARIKHYINKVQTEIDRELNISEFRKEIQNELNRIEALERKVHAQLEKVKQAKLEDLNQQPVQSQPKQSVVVQRYELLTTAQYIPFTTWQCLSTTAVVERQTNLIKLKIAV